MTDIYKELEEEIALAGGIDKLVQSDFAKMKEFAEQANDKIRREFERDLRREFERDLERQKEQNQRQDRMLQGLRDEAYRRTKVKIYSYCEASDVEETVNNFLCMKQDDTKKSFTLIDIKYSTGVAYSEALVIYSEIDKPREVT